MSKKLLPIQKMIYEIRGQRVMLDRDLAGLYGVELKVMNQAVKRNIERFPPDFMFQLTDEEWEILRSQFVTANENISKVRSHVPSIALQYKLWIESFKFNPGVLC